MSLFKSSSPKTSLTSQSLSPQSSVMANGSSAASPKIIKQEILHSGFIEKKSPKGFLARHVWQARWFVLYLVTYETGLPKRILTYYKNKDELDKPSGSITVENIKEIDVSTEKNGRFDINVDGRTYALRAEKEEVAQKWISIMADSLKEKDAVKYVKPTNVPDNPFEAMKMLARDNDEAANLDADDTIMMMEDGGAFLYYVYDEATKETEKSIVMLYLKQDSNSGILHWTEPGDSAVDPNPKQSLELKDLTDLFLGKNTPALRSKHSVGVDPEKCFTVRSPTVEFNFEGDTKEQVAAWLFGINSIMINKGGKKLRTVDESKPSLSRESSLDPSKKPSNSPTLEAKSQVGKWLLELGPAFQVYEAKFEENGVDMALLPSLEEDDLTELGVTSGLHKKKMMKSIKKLARDRVSSDAVNQAISAVINDVPEAPGMGVPPPPGAPGAPGDYSVRKVTLTARPLSRSKVNEMLASNTSAGGFDAVLGSIKDAKLKSASDRKLADKPVKVDYIGNIALMAAQMAEARKKRMEAKASGSNPTTPTQPTKNLSEEASQSSQVTPLSTISEQSQTADDSTAAAAQTTDSSS